jgi:hypothetical protein
VLDQSLGGDARHRFVQVVHGLPAGDPMGEDEGRPEFVPAGGVETGRVGDRGTIDEGPVPRSPSVS